MKLALPARKLQILALGLWMGISNQALAVYRNLELTEAQKKEIIGVRLVDLAKYSKAIPGLSESEAEGFEKDFDRYVEKEFKLNETLNLFVYDLPKVSSAGIVLPLTAFGKLEEAKSFAFIQMEATFNGEGFEVVPTRIIPLSETLFSLNVSLADRKLIMRDNLNPENVMVFPLGVGSFDQGVLNDAVTLLTPRFENAYVDQYAVISKRKKPRYFSNKPFIRITTAMNPGNGWTAIGFHVQPNLDTFVRAFDSHGCMRMQLKDLEMLHDLIMEGPHRRLSIDVKFWTEDVIDHPFPKRNKPYKKVLNAGSKEEPRWILDRDDLVQTTMDWENSAPVSLLKDQDGDSHHEIYDYAMAWRKEERAEAKKEACLADFPYTTTEDRRERRKLEKEFEDCMKEGTRRRSLRDRVYRWWVH